MLKVGSIVGDDSASAPKWYDYRGARLLIAPVGTKAYDAALARLSRKDRRLRQRSAAGLEVEDEMLHITMKVTAHAVLKGWEGIMEDDGSTPIPYSPEKALEFFEKSYKFYRAVASFALGAAAQEAEEQEEDSKN